MQKINDWLGVAFLLSIFLLVGCTPFGGGPTVDSLVAALRGTGASVQPGGAMGETLVPPFAVPSQLLQVNGDEVQLYLYADAAAAQADAGRVSPDGFTFTPLDD